MVKEFQENRCPMKTALPLRLFVCLLCLSVASTFVGAQQLPPAADNFKQWAALSHKLEAAPLDIQLNRDAEVAVHEISQSPDFHTPLCTSFFTFFNKLTAEGYPYQAQVYRLYTLGSATYRIETGKTDSYGTNFYAFDSILKGYQYMLQKEPKARNRTLEDLYVTALKGKLPDYLKKDSTCK
jgi:hypothetical protein